MSERRIWPVARWVGAPFPVDARYDQTPALLVELMDERGVPWELQELERRLVERARLGKSDKLWRASARGLAADWKIDRKTLARRLRALAAAGFISLHLDDDEHSPSIDLEPTRDLLKARAARLESGATIAQRGVTVAHDVATNGHGGAVTTIWDGAVVGHDRPTDGAMIAPQVGHDRPTSGPGSGSKPPDRRRRQKTEERDATTNGVADAPPEPTTAVLRDATLEELAAVRARAAECLRVLVERRP